MSTAVQLAAFAFADALVAASPGDKPYRAVVFLLSLAGHRRAGANDRTARDLHTRSHLRAKKISADLRTAFTLDYDPLDVFEFGSFDDLLTKRPPGGAQWQDIILITHGSGEQPAGFTGQIFFGREVFTISGSGTNDLLDAINAKKSRVTAFRKGFDPEAASSLIGCGVGATGPDVAIYVRELFGVEGQIKFPIKNVDFFRNGELGIAKNPDNPREGLRPLTDDDWRIVAPKKPTLTGDRIPPSGF